jgi:hypothetical protein
VISGGIGLGAWNGLKAGSGDDLAAAPSGKQRQVVQQATANGAPATTIIASSPSQTCH